MIGDINDERAAQTAAELSAGGKAVKPFTVNISAEMGGQQLVDCCAREFCRVDIPVNNAGIGINKRTFVAGSTLLRRAAAAHRAAMKAKRPHIHRECVCCGGFTLEQLIPGPLSPNASRLESGPNIVYHTIHIINMGNPYEDHNRSPGRPPRTR